MIKSISESLFLGGDQDQIVRPEVRGGLWKYLAYFYYSQHVQKQKVNIRFGYTKDE